jgi:hypothetical protein
MENCEEKHFFQVLKKNLHRFVKQLPENNSNRSRLDAIASKHFCCSLDAHFRSCSLKRIDFLTGSTNFLYLSTISKSSRERKSGGADVSVLRKKVGKINHLYFWGAKCSLGTFIVQVVNFCGN